MICTLAALLPWSSHLCIPCPCYAVTMQLVTSFTATTLWKGRGFANLMAMDGLVDPANGFVSSTGAVRFQLRTRTNRNRSGLDGVQHVEPFADLYNHLWAPDRGVQVETSAR